ncbi:MAG: ATP:cob(I)alamin adenosyltransferase [Bdellovibrio sp.]|nr:MAG: ATP:cob(I)alamin adenosyltransferase [Bdellovibrio sp.]
MKIYTGVGDAGTTQLAGGTTVSKAHLRVQAYGSLDELNSLIGLAAREAQNHPLRRAELEILTESLLRLQHQLFNAGATIACDKPEVRARLPQLKPAAAHRLETAIDQMTEKLPLLTEFVLPGGHPLACHLHVARSVCRRAERDYVNFLNESGESDESYHLLVFLNRLSDYFFTAARYANFVFGVNDQAWRKDLA